MWRNCPMKKRAARIGIGMVWFGITMMIGFDYPKWFEDSFVGTKQE